ncbi:MAG: class I SAM-dependent methyltransferase [Fibrobacterota bacterium]|nr:class I SAM-dependent methyltransferase [Fibrobacterota bacterium]
MGTNIDGMTKDWDHSYERRENFVFWPSDNAIRFVSRYLRKRVGLDAVQDVLPGAKGSKVLDFGCGIGRHIQFGHSMGLEMYGIELSSVAVGEAHKWAHEMLKGAEKDRIRVGDVRELPWKDGFFDHALSDSVVDSMSIEIARKGVSELARVLKPGGLFYCNLIAEKDPVTGELFSGEKEVTTAHEQGTIQSYFDKRKIDDLFSAKFETLQSELHTVVNVLTGGSAGRWHLVLRRK